MKPGDDLPSAGQAGGAPTRRSFLVATAAGGLLGLKASPARSGEAAAIRIGRRFLSEQGMGAGLALLEAEARSLRRLRREDMAMFEAAVAADFRSGRTVSVAGVRMSALETARCVAFALGRGDLV